MKCSRRRRTFLSARPPVRARLGSENARNRPIPWSATPMSFRTRLLSFFVVIVVVPMAAMAFLVFRLIDDSQSGKADARAEGVTAVAQSVYGRASTPASLEARTLARALAGTPASQLAARTAQLAGQAGLARVTVRVGSRLVADVGDRSAVAPGIAVVTGAAGTPTRTISASQLTADGYARELAGPGIGVSVRSGPTPLASPGPTAASRLVSAQRGSVTIGPRTNRLAATPELPGFGASRVRVLVLSDE